MNSDGIAHLARQVREKIAAVPRVSLAFLPTPLQEAPNLARRLGGPRIFIKRDDLTGVAFGGNKTRNLEFRLARAIARTADTVLVGLDVQSNSARQTAGCCNKLGLRSILVLTGPRPNEVQGNLLVDYLLGAEVHFVPDAPAQRARLDALAAALRSAGKRPYILNDDPMFDMASALAYIECTIESLEAMRSLGLAPTHLYMSSSGKGQAGLELAKRLLHADFAICGVTATDEFDVAARTAEIANRTAAEVGFSVRVSPAEITNFADQVGPGYGIATAAGDEAVRLFAETEGIVLDPIYSGKCAAAMIAHIRAGRFKPDDALLFVHTGGNPAIFSHSRAWLPAGASR
jgi:1-aminocyclopropane-1-carboxylate deaminase/D-cysteine desulfhydrase-like pyridoxal-dependent ACC family enzyme